MKHRLLLVLALLMSPFVHAEMSREDGLRKMTQELESPEGLRLRVHGVNNEAKLYVGAYIYETIFNEIQVSLLSRERPVRDALITLGRHDVIRVWGRVLNFDAPQPHLALSRLVVEEKYQFPGGEHRPDVDWDKVTQELQGRSEALMLVHTVQMDGQLLVVEFKDQIFPIFTREFQAQAKNLSRQDIIRIRYELQESPEKPIHLVLKGDAQGQAIDVVDSINTQHGKTMSFEGNLVMFPQSPIVKFNVFAIKVALENDMHRTYTLINFEDPEFFAQIRAKLQAAWDAGDESCVKNDRNKLLSTCVRVRATGFINHVDPNQANPQILPSKIEDIEVLGDSQGSPTSLSSPRF
jgi:hypothetical protein